MKGTSTLWVGKHLMIVDTETYVDVVMLASTM